jgi:hypothetical protein
MRLSVNTCICEYLTGGDDEAERDHWHLQNYLRGDEDEAVCEQWYLQVSERRGR